MDDRTLGEKISDSVTQFGGSWKFIIFAAIFFSSWILFNALTFLDVWQFDPYPFILMNLVLSFIAAFQAPFIMMSQNRAERKQDEAYRFLLGEIKELIEQDMDSELRIETLEIQIVKELEIMRNQQAKLMERLQHAITLEKITHQEIGEILARYEEEDKEDKEDHSAGMGDG